MTKKDHYKIAKEIDGIIRRRIMKIANTMLDKRQDATHELADLNRELWAKYGEPNVPKETIK